MRKIILIINLCIPLLLLSFGCTRSNQTNTSNYKIPSLGHNLSYISFDAEHDDPNFTICDSTRFASGRSRLKFTGGTNKFRRDILANYLAKKEYESFSGYVVVRFIVNCEGVAGRFRSEALNLDFSASDAPSDLLDHSIQLVKNLGSWKRSAGNAGEKEYSKFINLKIRNGQIHHVLH